MTFVSGSSRSFQDHRGLLLVSSGDHCGIIRGHVGFVGGPGIIIFKVVTGRPVKQRGGILLIDLLHSRFDMRISMHTYL